MSRDAAMNDSTGNDSTGNVSASDDQASLVAGSLVAGLPGDGSLVDGSVTHPRGLHRLIWLLVGLVWPLIWVGGLVTTYDAGMSVPDWPGTYGYNLFLYPYKTWLLGPFDLFIEHGHRLLGAVVGLVAIAVVVAAFRTERRRSVRWLCVGLLVMVIAQGLLGGFRVVLSDRVLAMIHGCFGPAFFAVCASSLVITGRWWVGGSGSSSPRRLGLAVWLASVLMIAMAYGQLVLGALMRHSSPTSSASSFAAVVGLHVAGAFALWLVSALVWWRISRLNLPSMTRPAGWLFVFVGIQIGLGIGTWVVNYGYPRMLAFMPGSESYLIQAKGFIESIIVTGHVATGSLVLATATFLAVRGYRVRSGGFTTERSAGSNAVLESPPEKPLIGQPTGQPAVAT